MIARIAWFAAIALVACVTLFAQIDRQSRVAPELASAVPAPFRAFAQPRFVADAIQSKDPQRALEEARLLVMRRPIPAEHLRLLAIAQIEAGQAEDAMITIQLAGKRGWRDRFAQETVLRLALAAGDEPEAARRYAALLRNKTIANDLLVELASPVLGGENSAGRAEFVRIISESDRWNRYFLSRGAVVIPGETFADIVIRSREQGAEFACEDLQRAIGTLEARDTMAADMLRVAVLDGC
jgi:hypothetical protein